MKKRILCYGDSLTWGYYPIKGTRISQRWPQIMAEDLGDEYVVIEDGLNGRTTCLDKPWSCYRNGLSSLPYSLIAQKPIDLFILFLGTNDYSLIKNADEAFNCMENFIYHVINANIIYGKTSAQKIFEGKPEILFVIPGPIKNTNLSLEQQDQDKEVLISKLVQDKYEQLANKYHLHYIFAKDYAVGSDMDGVHYMPEEHVKLGHAMADKVKEIFGRLD